MKTYILPIVFLLAAFTLSAQDRLSLELRANGAFPTEQLGGADLQFGFGFEGAVNYRILPHLGAYAGWGWHRFTTDEFLTDTNIDVEETGYTFGLQFMHPLGVSSLSYYVRAGGIYNHLELENESGDIMADTGHGLGWQVGAGVAIPLGRDWHLLPGVKYSSLSRDLAIGDYRTTADLKYVSVGVGIYKTF